ncbi:MAG: hypothetical protein ABIM88_01795 [candidate division WOR-3 bacterium]
MTSLDVLWVAVAFSVILIAVGLFIALLELRNLLRDARNTVRITNAELPDILKSLSGAVEEIRGAASNLNLITGGLASVSGAISSVSEKLKGGWFGTGLAAGIDLIRNLFRRRKEK